MSALFFVGSLALCSFPEIPLLEISTLCNLDGFALGALCAHGFRHSHFAFAWLSRHRVETSLLCLALAVVVGLLPLPLGTGKMINFGLLSVTYAALLISCVHGVKGPTRFLVNFPPFQYLGRISYGLYLLHNLAYVPANSLLRRFSFIPDHDVARIALYTLLTIAGSAALYHFFERPIYRLKDKFPYPPHRSSFTNAAKSAASVSPAVSQSCRD